MGLVIVVIRVLANYDDLDIVEGSVARPRTRVRIPNSSDALFGITYQEYTSSAGGNHFLLFAVSCFRNFFRLRNSVVVMSSLS